MDQLGTITPYLRALALCTLQRGRTALTFIGENSLHMCRRLCSDVPFWLLTFIGKIPLVIRACFRMDQPHLGFNICWLFFFGVLVLFSYEVGRQLISLCKVQF